MTPRDTVSDFARHQEGRGGMNPFDNMRYRSHIFLPNYSGPRVTPRDTPEVTPEDPPQDTPPGPPRSYPPVPPEDVMKIDLETICTVISLVMLHLETMLEIPVEIYKIS